MWIANGNELTMAEGDYGIKLPIKITGMTFGSSDVIAVIFKKAANGQDILTKVFTNIQQSTINLEFTEQETALFPVGKYVYRIDAYQNGNYLNNIIPSASLKVVDVV